MGERLALEAIPFLDLQTALPTVKRWSARPHQCSIQRPAACTPGAAIYFLIDLSKFDFSGSTFISSTPNGLLFASELLIHNKYIE